MIDRIVIVGAGAMGRTLTQRLLTVAPITILDRSAAALPELDAPAAAAPAPPAQSPPAGGGKTAHSGLTPAPPGHEVRRLVADATSRMVLEDLRGEVGASAVALVAATGSDRINLEVCRLGAELMFKPLVAMVIDPAVRPGYEALGARCIIRTTLLVDAVERALRSDGVVVASSVGLGTGEIIEIRVLSSSPAIGQRLEDLHPQGWRVAAIYRGTELVLPMESTTVQLDDRLLLVGDPQILPHIGEHLRIGLPDFPLRYGPNIVVYLPSGRDRRIEVEAEVLTLKTRAYKLIRMHPGANPSRTVVDTGDSPHGAIRTQAKEFLDLPLDGTTLSAQVRSLLEQHPGLIVAMESRRLVRERLLGMGGRDTWLCNLSPVPVLFADGAPHLQRIVMVVGGGVHDLRTADAAVDLARMLGLPLTLLRTELPGYLSDGDTSQDHVEAAIEQRANLYGIRVATERRVGNPVAEVARFAHDADLCVVARRRVRRDSFSSPDVALRIVHATPCSILVISV